MGKVKLKNLAKLGNNLVDGSKCFNNVSFKASSNSHAESIDGSLQSGLETIIPFCTITAWAYYMLKNSQDKLSKEITEEIQKLWEIQSSTMMKEEINSSILEIVIHFYKKFIILDSSKSEYSSKNNIIFDDISQEHKDAFTKNGKTIFPKNNLLLKFTHKDTHIRVGISLEDSLFIEYINIANKKDLKK